MPITTLKEGEPCPVVALRWHVLCPDGTVEVQDGNKEPTLHWGPMFVYPAQQLTEAFVKSEGTVPATIYAWVRATPPATALAAPAWWSHVPERLHPTLQETLPGWSPEWSLLHERSDPSYLGGQVDGALRPYLERIHARGYETASSCQGGYVPLATKALEKWGSWHSPDWAPGPTIEDKVWGRRKAHLFVTAGVGHGRGGVARGEVEMYEVVPDPAVVAEAARIMSLFEGVDGLDVQVIADEMLSYCVLESGHLTDDGAREWWEEVTRVLCG